ncbi:MAG: hypothetical protein RML95_05185 [Anaerolineae bacterium]|nr:hypothetical protein [Anaerolineae bacterium]
MRKLLFLITSLCLLAAHMPSQAQDEPSLVRMVRAVPFAELSGDAIIGYIDYAALQEALPNSVRPMSLQEFQELREANSSASEWYHNGLSATSVGQFDLQFADPQTVGFDFYSVDRVLLFAAEQTAGRLYAGRFERAAVRSAFLARAYSVRERDSLLVLCGDPACDAELARRENPAERNSGNPFGGSFGRREPVALGEGVILSSPDMATFEAMITAYNGGAPSLLQNDAMRALLTVLNVEGTAVQALFFSADRLGTAEQGIPRYELAALIHLLQPDGTQPNYIALVYTDENDAKAAAAALPERMAQHQVKSQLITETPRPFLESLAERKGSLAPVRLVALDRFAQLEVRYALLVPFESPAPRDIPQNVTAERPAPLLVFRLLSDALFEGDLGFLAVSR